MTLFQLFFLKFKLALMTSKLKILTNLIHIELILKIYLVMIKVQKQHFYKMVFSTKMRLEKCKLSMMKTKRIMIQAKLKVTKLYDFDFCFLLKLRFKTYKIQFFFLDSYYLAYAEFNSVFKIFFFECKNEFFFCIFA